MDTQSVSWHVWGGFRCTAGQMGSTCATLLQTQSGENFLKLCMCAQLGQLDMDTTTQTSAQVGGTGQDVAQMFTPHETMVVLFENCLNLAEKTKEWWVVLGPAELVLSCYWDIPSVGQHRIAWRPPSCCHPSALRWRAGDPPRWSRPERSCCRCACTEVKWNSFFLMWTWGLCFTPNLSSSTRRRNNSSQNFLVLFIEQLPFKIYQLMHLIENDTLQYISAAE